MDNNKSEELIHQQMQETRASLTEKLETLEQKVVGTVEGATTAVSETVEAIKGSVHDTVNTVNETVKESAEAVKDFLDVPAHVERHPWLAVGSSVAVGYFLGALLAPKAPVRSSGSTGYYPAMPPISNGGMPSRRVEQAAPDTAVDAPSMFAPEIAKLKGLALGVLFGTAREMLVSSMPEHLGEQVKSVVDNVTRKAGGEPLPSADVAQWCDAAAPDTSSQEESESVSGQEPMTAGNGRGATRRW